MALLEALSSDELFNFFIHDSISPTSCVQHDSSLLEATTSFFLENDSMKKQPYLDQGATASDTRSGSSVIKGLEKRNLAVHRKRRRRPRICKNKEEAETQRMTHIAVERNRRRQMNHHLAVLRSLVPESYTQRGDQASIVGGAIEFVKELEHLVQSFEAQKFQQLSPPQETPITKDCIPKLLLSPFPQSDGLPNKYTSKTNQATADIEVTLIESHANVRILWRRSPQKLLKMVVGFQMLCLAIIHLNVTTLGELVLYTVSAKMEEGCQLTSVDDIAGAVHHLLRIIEAEGAPC